MNSFSSDQMLLPSINHLLDPDIKCESAATLRQSLLSDVEGAGCHGDVEKSPKFLTPPDSPVFSELTAPSYLLKMASHDGSQMVPNLEANGMLEGALHMNFPLPLDCVDTLNDLEYLHTRDIVANINIKQETDIPEVFYETVGAPHDWSGLYIEDHDHVPSPTPSPPFDGPSFYEAADLTTIDNLTAYSDQTRLVERRKYNSMGTEDSLQSDSGSDEGSCPSPPITTNVRPFHSHHFVSKGKSIPGGRTHNYQRRTITKSLTQLEEEGLSSLSSSLSSSSSSSSCSERRKRGRPRKRTADEMSDSDEVPVRYSRKQGRKSVKGSHLWEFILELLKTDTYCPRYIKWENRNEGIFRIVNSKVVANMWGDIKNNPRMTYEKLSRAMRYYYKRQILERVDKARLVYKFGEKAEGWRKIADEE